MPRDSFWSLVQRMATELPDPDKGEDERTPTSLNYTLTEDEWSTSQLSAPVEFPPITPGEPPARKPW